MPAQITFVLGRAGSGKSTLAHTELKRALDAGEKPILIVPEQYTYEAEQQLCRDMGGGLIGANVLSFTTLARRVLDEKRTMRAGLSRQGRKMVIRRAIRTCLPKLTTFRRTALRPGFVDKLDELLSLCKRFEITPQALADAANAPSVSALLKDKLNDLSIIFEQIQQLLGSKYIDGDDAFGLATGLVANSSYANRPVIIDGFDILTTQLYEMLRALMSCSRSMLITLCLDTGARRDEPLFRPERRAFQRLKEIADELGCAVSVRELKGAYKPSRALNHLESELYAYPFDAWQGDADEITLFAASDMQAEAEALADAVQQAARDGIRYRDMAVIASDTVQYALPIQRAFKKRGIPMFMDEKHPIQGHPAVELVCAALKSINGGFSQSAFLQLIKTGLAGIDRDGAEKLENYVLRRGIMGGRLTKPFDDAELEQSRIAVMQPLLKLREGLSGKNAALKTRALYEYLEALNVGARLDELAQELYSQGRYELMEENAQIWDMLMELLDQLYLIMGDDEVSNTRYLELINEGVSAYDVGVIPTTADQVLLGGITRTRSRAVDALFVVGCLEGLFPACHKDDGIIDDAELAALKDIGVAAWGSTLYRMQNDSLDIYRALSRPKERLYMSYCVNAAGGKCEPGEMFDKVAQIFPRVPIKTDIGTEHGDSMAELACSLREMLEGSAAAADMRLYSYYRSKPEYRDALESVEAGLFFTPQSERLNAAKKLSSVSASRLETFNSCPFLYYARYVLKAQSRREYGEGKQDEGELYHAALSALVDYIKTNGLDYAKLDEEQVHAIMDELLPSIFQAHNEGLLSDDPRLRFRLHIMALTCKATAWALVYQMGRGSFTPLGSELAFGANEQYPPLRIPTPNGDLMINGKIDRADASPDGALRVIDYKLGGRDFDLGETYSGLRLQLPLYLCAAEAAFSGVGAGMYYMGVLYPYCDKDYADDDKLKAALISSFRMRGLTLNEDVTLTATDRELPGTKSSVIYMSKEPPLLSREQMDKLTTFAKHIAAETSANIASGRIAPMPYIQDKRTPCGWCDFRSLCWFDPEFAGCAHRRIKPLKLSEFLERIEPEEEKQ